MVPVAAPSEPQPQSTASSLYQLLVPYYGFQENVPEDIFKKIWLDNNKFSFEKYIFSDEFFTFVREVMGSVKLPDFKPTRGSHFSPLHVNYPDDKK